jgi:hypothetical protein
MYFTTVHRYGCLPSKILCAFPVSPTRARYNLFGLFTLSLVGEVCTLYSFKNLCYIHESNILSFFILEDYHLLGYDAV